MSRASRADNAAQLNEPRPTSTTQRGTGRPKTESTAPPERVIVFRGRTALAVVGVVLGVAAAVKLVLLTTTGLTLIAIAAFVASRRSGAAG